MRVWSRTQDGTLASAPITQTFQRQVDGHLRLELADGRVLQSTAEHPFWDAATQAYRPLGTFHEGERLWTQAVIPGRSSHHLVTYLRALFTPLTRGLQPLHPVTLMVTEDRLQQDGKESEFAGSIQIRAIVPIKGPIQVFNLTVAGTHTYFADGVLVHNKTQPPPATQ